MTKYRIIEPARPHPSFGNVDRIERYRYGHGERAGLGAHMSRIMGSLYLEAQSKAADLIHSWGLCRDAAAAVASANYPKISPEGRIKNVVLTHPQWGGSGYVIEIGGVVTTIEPSYLDAWIRPRPPEIDGRRWANEKGVALSTPMSVRVRLALDLQRIGIRKPIWSRSWIWLWKPLLIWVSPKR